MDTTAREAFNEVVKSIQQDMPLLMHGSGDVRPNEVSKESARVLSELTANYISNLVDAAVNAHSILNDGDEPLPPPPLPRSKEIPKPSLPAPVPPSTTTSTTGKKSSSKSDSKSDSKKDLLKQKQQQQQPHQLKRRRRVTDEYWDEPLEEPKIKNHPARRKSSAQQGGPKFEGVPIDEWVGVSGVDFFDTKRSRKAYVSAPSAIGTSSFIFPVCHDPLLYGKVKEVQAAKRDMVSILADPAIGDVVKNEGANQGVGGLRKRNFTKSGSNNEDDLVEDPEETDSEVEDGATWPGLDGLVPVYMNRDFFGDK